MKSNTKKKDNNNRDNDILSNFNKKYNTDISINSSFIDLSNKEIDDEEFKLFSELPSDIFENVLELNLSQNCISDISPLILMNLNNLNTLNLSKNRIENIDVFEKLNLYNLQKLNLSNNRLTNINSFAKSNLFNLVELDLSNNRINDISTLEFINSPNIQKLDLFNNEILDITALERANFPQLLYISLASNYFNHEIIKNHDIISNLRKKRCVVNIYGTIKQTL